MARSLNRAQLIGNLTRDPELRYTPNGTAVCSFGLATNRSWKTDTGEKHDEAEFHNIVAWNKLAEICSQFLVKGRKVFVEGRISTRKWTGQDGTQRNTTEIVISDMILLDSKGAPPGASQAETAPASTNAAAADPQEDKVSKVEKVSPIRQAQGKQVSKGEEKKSETKEEKKIMKVQSNEEVAPDDIPF